MSSRRDLAAALMLFTMRLEVARARALEGFRTDDREGPLPLDLYKKEADASMSPALCARFARASKKPFL
jgi:hypothetical protein